MVAHFIGTKDVLNIVLFSSFSVHFLENEESITYSHSAGRQTQTSPEQTE